jgi:hypothetical protein
MSRENKMHVISNPKLETFLGKVHGRTLDPASGIPPGWKYVSKRYDEGYPGGRMIVKLMQPQGTISTFRVPSLRAKKIAGTDVVPARAFSSGRISNTVYKFSAAV